MIDGGLGEFHQPAMTTAHQPDEIPGVCAGIRFPTEAHRSLAAETAVALAGDPRVMAVCLTCSIARGVADSEADLDMVAFTAREHVPALEAVAERHRAASPEIHFDLEISPGNLEPGQQGWTNVDAFELEVGNYVAYARPLFERADAFQQLQARYLPYYEDALARSRAARFYEVTTNHADRMRRGLRRNSLFDPAERLRLGIQTFLAGLFVCRRVYPIDYTKWVEAQLTELLGLPELLPPLRGLFDIGPLDPQRLATRADALEALAERWLREA
jgi:hypothetical protein